MQIFEFTDYRQFLNIIFSGSGPGRGKRLKLAEYLNCQPSFLTQIFSEKAHLSLEHAIKTTTFLNFNNLEKEYFMLLVQKAKSGTLDLENYFDIKIKTIHLTRNQINSRIQVQTNLSIEDQMKYYSVWYYSAIHILSSIPGFQNSNAIAQKLKCDELIVKDALDFLVEKGFLKKMNHQFEIGSTRIHLKKGSTMLPRHHANWRMKAIESVDSEKESDLHYTAVLGIAKSDMSVFREKLLKMLEEFEGIITHSKEESEVVLLFDLFEL